MVADSVDPAVVGHPVKDDAVKGCGEATGQTEIQIVLGLQKFVGGGVPIGVLRLEVEDVGNGVFTGMPRNTARKANPGVEFVDPVPGYSERAVHQALDMVGPTGIHPNDGPAQRAAVAIDRHGSGPLARAALTGDAARVNTVSGKQAVGRMADSPPPVGGILLSPTAREEMQFGRSALAGLYTPVGAHEGHLGA